MVFTCHGGVYTQTVYQWCHMSESSAMLAASFASRSNLGFSILLKDTLTDLRVTGQPSRPPRHILQPLKLTNSSSVVWFHHILGSKAGLTAKTCWFMSLITEDISLGIRLWQSQLTLRNNEGFYTLINLYSWTDTDNLSCSFSHSPYLISLLHHCVKSPEWKVSQALSSLSRSFSFTSTSTTVSFTSSCLTAPWWTSPTVSETSSTSSSTSVARRGSSGSRSSKRRPLLDLWPSASPQVVHLRNSLFYFPHVQVYGEIT